MKVILVASLSFLKSLLASIALHAAGLLNESNHSVSKSHCCTLDVEYDVVRVVKGNCFGK